MNLSGSSEFYELKRIISENSRFLILSHRGPDGDTIGANLALHHALKNQLQKQVVSACFDPIPDTYYFLQDTEIFQNKFSLENFDIIISVDIATEGLLRFQEKYPAILSGQKPFINIDHHHDNTNFGTLNIVTPEAATAVIIYDFLKFCHFEINKDIATYLLTGIYFDTGNLMHSNTNSRIYRICSELIAKGADFKTISRNLFNTTPLNRLKLWGRIFEKMYMNEENVIIAAVTREDFDATETESEDASGIVDYLNMVEGAKYCMLLNENDKKGLVKGSLRTLHEHVNVSEVAHEFGGGGHKKASGFAIPGKLQQEIRWKVIPSS